MCSDGELVRLLGGVFVRWWGMVEVVCEDVSRPSWPIWIRPKYVSSLPVFITVIKNLLLSPTLVHVGEEHD